ncbi:MAG: uracil-DNA glycosylase [Chloroflexota bacterium]|nr:uracil-DNA glycosylase [Chloroflexota bacterium]
MSDERAAKLAEIAAQVRVCTLCDLHRGRKNAVPGAGDPHAEIMFIGEGPGFNEDQQGLPFVGRSGDYLVKLLKLIGLTRDQVFIGNVVKCRPPENRDPLPIEIATCKDYLDRQVQLIDPLMVCTLGRFSMARYFPNAKITQIHGKAKLENGRLYYPLFHPAAVLRSPSLEPQMEGDFRRIPELLAKLKQDRASGAVVIPVAQPPQDEPPPPPRQLTLF